MPLMGKRLKRKNLSTVTVTGGWPGAKPVRTYKANKRRIIFGDFAKMRIGFGRWQCAPKKNSDLQSPSLPHAARPVRRKPYRAAHFADRGPAFRLCLRGELLFGRRPIADCRTHRPRDRGQSPWKWPERGLWFLWRQLILELAEG